MSEEEHFHVLDSFPAVWKPMFANVDDVFVLFPLFGQQSNQHFISFLTSLWRIILKPLVQEITHLTPFSMDTRKDVFSRFVNWLSASGRDGSAINRQGGSPDFFSRLMNRISG